MKITEITPKTEITNRKIRLAAYGRVSSNSTQQEHSFAAQVQYFSQYVKEHPEYELVDIYADEGITGTEMDKRDELNRLLRDCKMGKIDRIVCKSLSRFARNTEELLTMIRMLKEFGVSIYFEDKDIDSDKLNMEMIVTFPAMAAQQESEAISGNLRWSYQKRMESGKFTCTYPAYGYDLINGELVINEKEAIIIRRTFELYMQGNGIQAIANIYNSEKLPRRHNKQLWHAGTIRYILTNEKYIGDSLTQKCYTTDSLPFRRKRNNGMFPKYYVEHDHEGIVSRETFDTAQALLKSRKNEQKKISYPLSGKLRCAECGSKFRRHQLGEIRYWICMKTASGRETCRSRRIRESGVYEAFICMIYKLKKYRTSLLGTVIDIIENTDMPKSKEKLARLDKEIADISAKKLVMTKLFTGGAISVEDWNTHNAALTSKLTNLRRKRREIIQTCKSEDEQALIHLNEILADYQMTSKFDCDLFEEIVDEIIVDSSNQLTFILYGGLTLTEMIPEHERCHVL